MEKDENSLASELLEHIGEIERLQSASASKQSSFSLAELAQSKSGYLIYKSSRRVEFASYVIAFLTIVLVVLTIVLIMKG